MTTIPPTSGDEIRAAFLRFFEERNHQIVPSSSLIPAGDPTLLLTSAGMVQFKPFYTGDETPFNPRLASVQKCFRTTDIDTVGDLTHNTFFEMLGNFSVGDYFKRESIHWGWEFLTKELNITPERLWATIYLDDDEAYDIWHHEVGLPDERIVRLGERDNFWGPAGSEGPCGPSSELHYDHGDHLAPGAKVGDEGSDDRFVEIWNLVFVQFYQDAAGRRTLLPAPSIDTGMGLERITTIMQAKPSVYETDLLAPVMHAVEAVSGKTYGQEESADYAMRVVAEHSRGAAFLIADGVVPSNEGRGYVLRRVIRRAVRYARQLAIEKGFMPSVADVVIGRMGANYPELIERRSFVLRALELEEKRFEQAISQGLPLLEREFIPLHRSENTTQQTTEAIAALSVRVSEEVRDGLAKAASTPRGRVVLGQAITGIEAFYLFDSFGFPLELTQEIAHEHNLEVDLEGFKREMEAQRQRGRMARSGAEGNRNLQRRYETLNGPPTEFFGYTTVIGNSTISGMLVDGRPTQEASSGDVLELVLAGTSFYAEGGGQVGDTGRLVGNGFSVEITNTRRPLLDLIVHDARMVEGTARIGDAVEMGVDAERRADIMRNHTATHMLHAALRSVLGTHVRQAGSLVAPDRLRFDFHHVAPVTNDEVTTIQRLVNEAVRKNLDCVMSEGTYHNVIADGALAFFGDRYPERVRTLRVGELEDPFSFEVCGGTHIDRTGEIGLFRITAEGGLGVGVRRIEAVTGRGADAWVNARIGILDEVSTKLNTQAAEVPHRVDSLLAELTETRRVGAANRRESSRLESEELLARQADVGGVAMIATATASPDIETMRQMGDRLRDKLGSGIIILGGVFGERPALIAMVTADLVKKGYRAGDIVKAAAVPMGGGGGGRPDVAQAGGHDASKLDEAITTAVQAVRTIGASL